MQAQKSKHTKDPWAAMDEIMAQEAEPTSPEWFTVEQFAARYNMSRAAHKKLKAFCSAGIAEQWKGLTKEGRRITTKYRLKPQ